MKPTGTPGAQHSQVALHLHQQQLCTLNPINLYFSFVPILKRGRVPI